jgi:hypothetical protein
MARDLRKLRALKQTREKYCYLFTQNQSINQSFIHSFVLRTGWKRTNVSVRI